MYNFEVILKILFKLSLSMTSLVFTSMIFTSAAFADPTPCTQAGFDKLQKEGK